MSNDLTYMRQLNTDILETISERFDNAVELMGKLGIVFGGAVRDSLAKLPLLGDIDILVSHNYTNIVKEAFIHSSKWAPDWSDLKEKLTRYNAKRLESILVYKNSCNATAQLIVPKTCVNREILKECNQKRDNSQSPEDKLIYALLPHVKTVDIICCGVFMLGNGEVFEALDGAYEDCLNKKLRLNPLIINADLDLGMLENRIKSLQERGWTSEINLEELKEEIFLLVEENKKRSRNVVSKYIHNNDVDKFIVDKLTKGIYIPILSTHVTDNLGTQQSMIENIRIEISFTKSEIYAYYVDENAFINTLKSRGAMSDVINTKNIISDDRGGFQITLDYRVRHIIMHYLPECCQLEHLSQFMSMITLSEFIRPITSKTNSGKVDINILTRSPGTAFIVEIYKIKLLVDDEFLYAIKSKVEQSLRALGYNSPTCTTTFSGSGHYDPLHTYKTLIRLDLNYIINETTTLITNEVLYGIMYKILCTNEAIFKKHKKEPYANF